MVLPCGVAVLDVVGSTFGSQYHTLNSQVVAIGLWDDFSVILSLDSTRPLENFCKLTLDRRIFKEIITGEISEISTNLI